MAPKTEQKIYVSIGLDFETGGLDCRECACTQIALQAVRFDIWQVFDRYQAYIAPYEKQDTGFPRRKVLRTRHEQAKEPEYVPMKYEQTALDYSDITMEMLRTQGVDMKNARGRTSNDIMERPPMIKNAYIIIITSPELSDMRLEELVGYRGILVEDLSQDRKTNRGGLVLLEKAYMDEFLWFIPEESISYE